MRPVAVGWHTPEAMRPVAVGKSCGMLSVAVGWLTPEVARPLSLSLSLLQAMQVFCEFK